MSKIETLKKNYEFKQVLTKGKSFSGKHIVLYVQKKKTDTNRIGIAVGKKVANSVKRNRIRRVIREAYRLIPNKRNSFWLVIVWKKSADIKEANYQVVSCELKQLLKKAQIIEEKKEL